MKSDSAAKMTHCLNAYDQGLECAITGTREQSSNPYDALTSERICWNTGFFYALSLISLENSTPQS